MEDEFHELQLVPKVELMNGSRVLGFTWVDMVKEGCAKTRWTVADLKSKGIRNDVFSPTPSSMANGLLEFRAIQRGDPIISAELVSAFPHAAEAEDIYVQAPPE